MPRISGCKVLRVGARRREELLQVFMRRKIAFCDICGVLLALFSNLIQLLLEDIALLVVDHQLLHEPRHPTPLGL